MNKLFFVTGISLLFFGLLSCNHPSTNQFVSTEFSSAKDTVIPDSHTSSNSLDYTGKYTGILPCADCEGIATEIQINKDNTYSKRIRYIGKGDQIFEEKGSYSWKSAGNTISLIGSPGNPSLYYVGENTLTQLDMKGNKITGDLAGNYILRK